MKVNQFHSGAAYGDAVTQNMLSLQRVLAGAGYEGNVYAEFLDEKLGESVLPIDAYRGDAGNLLIVHHSMGHDRFEQIVDLPDAKILLFQNITPKQFFPDAHTRHYIDLGWDQLKRYAAYIPFAFGASTYNERELLISGFESTAVLPILLDFEAYDAVPDNREFLAEYRDEKKILMVGRVMPHKCQHDLIGAFSIYNRQINPDSVLIITGGSDGSDYLERLKKHAEACGVSEKLLFTSHVDFATLVRLYRAADLYVSLSEHEGFCVPLIESMFHDVPVMAYATSAVPETLGGAGVLVHEKDMAAIAEMMGLLTLDEGLREAVLDKQLARREDFREERIAQTLLEAVERYRPGAKTEKSTTIRLEGPFETSYSLAIANRSLGQALDARNDCRLSLIATEGPGDYTPSEENLARIPYARKLYERGKERKPADVVIRDLFPPRVADADGLYNFLWNAWEDSRFPPEWMDDINRSCDGVMTFSSFVKKIFEDSGCKLPVAVVPCMVDPEFAAIEPKITLPQSDSLTFLCLGSGFPRKGVDVLLKAYFAEFTGKDPVRLVIKTFPNPHNTVAEEIKKIQKSTADAPEVIHIDCDIPPAETRGLYESADVLVSPSRSEGYNLPAAEAMVFGIPVIVTDYGGHLDFCDDSTAWLVRYTMAPSRSHLATEGAMWAEPDVTHLRELMRYHFENRGSAEIREKTAVAQERFTRESTWEKSAESAMSFIDEIRSAKPRIRLGMVTTSGIPCGIAEYSRFFLDSITGIDVRPVVFKNVTPVTTECPECPIVACWKDFDREPPQALFEAVVESRVSVLHIQFNFGFFRVGNLAWLLEQCERRGIKTLITFHATGDVVALGEFQSLKKITEVLSKCSRLIVHNKADLNYFRELGLESVTELIPQGNVVFKDLEKAACRSELGLDCADPVLATFGFLLPHKGVAKTMEAVELLKKRFPGIHLLATNAHHTDPVSLKVEEECRESIRSRKLEDNITLNTDYLSEAEIFMRLQAADIVLMPYEKSAESASAAVRFALAAGRPVVVTECEIFMEVAGVTHTVPDNRPNTLAKEITRLLDDPERMADLAARARDRAEETSWPTIGKRYGKLLLELINGE
jgi:glycosyltransferase involved in cell wall biosynthesis